MNSFMKNCHFGGWGTLGKSPSLESLFKTHMAAQAARLAFTLAEVLVTLGIIGVVSAMTLPTLVKNHQRQVYVTQLHKVYNEISQAVEQVITDSNAVSLGESELAKKEIDGAEYFVRNYFKTSKICSTRSASDCFADSYKNINGGTVRIRSFINPNDGYCASALLANGASVYFITNGGRYYQWGIYTVVDVNGKQGPNILGRDLFDFVINNDGTIAVGGDVEELASDFSTNCGNTTTQSTYGACFAKILNDGWKMDY